MNASPSGSRLPFALVITTLGVVFGDIGTSPLYALRECFHGPHAVMPTEKNVLGVLSLILWSLVLIVSIKYLTLVMRADNKGEGGILALLSLAFPKSTLERRRVPVLAAIGLFGAALLYGDGIITPAISVLSAVEGLNVATPQFEPYILPISVVILIALFGVQRWGTAKVGNVFGPITVVWFLALGTLGIRGILSAPQVLRAINPLCGLDFFRANGWDGFMVLGSVFLAVTGAEALYADMGHFGYRPIRFGWFALVMPSLLLNYFGQGALLLLRSYAALNPFYNLVPVWALYPMVILATAATIIASQALISGAFSLSVQAIQMGYLPRMEIKHTSSDSRGQIYLPQVNWALMIACVGLILGFRTSSNLAAAYGIAVTLTMLATTVLFGVAARRLWNWSKGKACALCALLLLVELGFFAANFLKVTQGGWFPLVVGVLIFTVMTTWKTGRRLLFERLQSSALPYQMFVSEVRRHPPMRVSGTAVFLSGNPDGAPIALLHNLKHNKVLHVRTVLLTVVTDEVPHVEPQDRVEIEHLDMGLYRVIGHYGFMEEPNVPELLDACGAKELMFQPETTTFFMSRETIIATHRAGMAIWREELFALMARNAQRATAFFGLPANRVVELGMQVEI